jgi:hypothetical protein
VTELRNAALRYAARGLPVFPLRHRDKIPLTTHGFLDATAECDQVFAWWRRWPGANIGVPTGPCSGWLVVDLDGAEGVAAWAALEQRHGQAPTLTSRTGRGRHLVYAYPPDRELGNTSGRLGPRIDTRADGGYVVVPPSVHPTGQPYRWSQSTPPGVSGPQEAPTWLLEALAEAPAPTPRSNQGGGYVVGVMPSGLPRHLRAQVNEAPGERRARQTWRLVCAALEWGLSDSEAHALLAAHAPTVEKYGGRAPAEVERILRRVRGDHPHAGRPCDLADCPRAPRWMVTA